jgi:hypothetical protein
MVTVTVLVAADIATRLSTWDEGVASPPVVALSVAVSTLVTVGSLYGGSLVYDYAFNVEQDFAHAYERSEVDKVPGQG